MCFVSAHCYHISIILKYPLVFHQLKPQLPQYLIRHILILPSPSRQSLELNAMQTQQRDLDDEDFEFKDHAPAQFALDMCAGLPHSSGRRPAMIATDALVRGVGVSEAGVPAVPTRCPWCLWGLFGFPEIFPLPVHAIAITTTHKTAEADSSTVTWGLVPVAAWREIDDFLEVDAWCVSAAEAASNLGIFYTQLF